MTNHCYLNGTLVTAEEAHIAASDRSYLLGDGLFETILVRDGQPRLLEQHIARLLSSAAALGYGALSSALLFGAVWSVVKANSLDVGALRLTISPSTSDGLLVSPHSALNTYIAVRRGEPYPAEQYERGFVAVISRSTRRNEHSPLCRHKTTGFMDSVLAKQEARSRQADEAILLNTTGNVAEGAVTNLFIVRGGEVLTPRLTDGALPGIMRAEVLRACVLAGIPVQEATLTPAHIFTADEAFVTNALLGVMPLSSVDAHTFARSNATIARGIIGALTL